MIVNHRHKAITLNWNFCRKELEEIAPKKLYITKIAFSSEKSTKVQNLVNFVWGVSVPFQWHPL